MKAFGARTRLARSAAVTSDMSITVTETDDPTGKVTLTATGDQFQYDALDMTSQAKVEGSGTPTFTPPATSASRKYASPASRLRSPVRLDHP